MSLFRRGFDKKKEKPMSLKNITLLLGIASLVMAGCNSAKPPPAPTSTALPIDTPVPTSTSTASAPPPTALPAECSEFNLTPEECINVGTHEYSTSTQILFDQTGQSCFVDDSNITVSFKFSADGRLHYIDSYETEVEFARKGQNQYTGGYVQPDGKFEWKNTITFTDAGFTEEANSYDLEKNEPLCTFIWEQKFITQPAAETQPLPIGGTATLMSSHISPLGVSFAYPDRWLVSELEGIISIGSSGNIQPMQETYKHGEILLEIHVAPLDFQISSNPLAVLGTYTNFLGIDLPDKEPAHMVNLNGREFAIGTYSEDYFKTAAHGNRAPLFIATHFTESNTLLLNMYATPKDEPQLRRLFEDFLISIEASP